MTERAPYPSVRGYQIERLLGRGGMARVYLATQLALARPVALKVLQHDSAAEDAGVVRFEQEARLIAKLSHPHIVGIYDIGRTEAGELYYAMPHLPAGDLQRRTRPLAEAEVRTILSATLNALEHAHNHGVVHRDIKPANILFDADGRAQLADFGVAFSEGSQRNRVTTAGFTVGSAGYMSPEQARGLKVDGRSDLYSVGVLAFEMLTGELPFEGADAVAIAIAQVEQPVPRLPAALAHWQPWMDGALACLPQDRFDTALSMRTALPLPPEPVAPRSKRIWAAVAAALLVTLALAALLALTRSKATDAAAIEAMIQRGALAPPTQPNALDTLRQARAQMPPMAGTDTLPARLTDALAQRAEVAAKARDWVALNDALTPLQDAVSGFAQSDSTRVRAFYAALDQLIVADLAGALQRYARADAESALALSALLPQLPAATAALREKVLRLPDANGEFADIDGLRLKLIQPPSDTAAGWAVTALPLRSEHIAPVLTVPARAGCISSSAAQSCISWQDAKTIAASVSQKTGQRYRLPTTQQWRLAQPLLRAQDNSLAIWTSTCKRETVVVDKPNAIERGAGRIRQLFGGQQARIITSERCAGYYTIGFGTTTTALRASSAADTSVAMVLLREIPALDP